MDDTDSGTRAGEGASRRLLAILCNPPLGAAEDTTSWRNVEILARVLDADSFEIVNLIEQPTRSTRDLAELAGGVDLERLTRRLATAARASEVVVAAWGARAPAHWRKVEWSTVVQAAVSGLVGAGHTRIAHVSTAPRHPSRWRQHTSPTHKRYPGETFEDRLLAALTWSQAEALVP